MFYPNQVKTTNYFLTFLYSHALPFKPSTTIVVHPYMVVMHIDTIPKKILTNVSGRAYPLYNAFNPFTVKQALIRVQRMLTRSTLSPKYSPAVITRLYAHA